MESTCPMSTPRAASVLAQAGHPRAQKPQHHSFPVPRRPPFLSAAAPGGWPHFSQQQAAAALFSFTPCVGQEPGQQRLAVKARGLGALQQSSWRSPGGRAACWGPLGRPAGRAGVGRACILSPLQDWFWVESADVSERPGSRNPWVSPRVVMDFGSSRPSRVPGARCPAGFPQWAGGQAQATVPTLLGTVLGDAAEHPSKPPSV